MQPLQSIGKPWLEEAMKTAPDVKRRWEAYHAGISSGSTTVAEDDH